MKKVLLASILSLVVLTGCGKKQTITCTQSEKTMGIGIEQVIRIDLESNKFKGINMIVDVVLPESMMSQKQTIIKSYERIYADFDKQYGVTPEVSESDKGVKVTANMSAEQAKKFSGSNNTKTSRKEVIEVFEKQGYTCK